MSRSPLRRRSGSRVAPIIMTAPARCAIWSKIICCNCSLWSRWSRRPSSTRPKSATKGQGASLIAADVAQDHFQPCRARQQFGAGAVDGAPVAAYADERGRPSDAHTFVAIKAHVDNWRWAGVPFYLRTGKRMPVRRTEILIQFKDVPHSIFASRRAPRPTNC